jgi:hypothetical protein
LESSDKRIETAQNKKALKQISKLKSWFNPDPSRFMEVKDSGRDLVVESANFTFFLIWWKNQKHLLKHIIIQAQMTKSMDGSYFEGT